jgi:hypothetical protein
LHRVLVFVLFFALAGASHASKSVEECEAEIGKAAESNRELVSKCLLESMGVIVPAVDPVRAAKVFILDFGIHKHNSVGGVEPFAIFANPKKDTTIKYITLTVALYNAVGDQIRSSIGGGAAKTIKYTGPLVYQGRDDAYWEPVWYNGTAACIAIQGMSIEYMNGKRTTLVGRDLREAIAPEVENSCRYK